MSDTVDPRILSQIAKIGTATLCEVRDRRGPCFRIICARGRATVGLLNVRGLIPAT